MFKAFSKSKGFVGMSGESTVRTSGGCI